GVAFDVGTTAVVGTLMTLRTGMAASVLSTLNGQAPCGADVISRISHGMNGPDAIHELQHAVVSTMNSILAELYRDAGVSPMQTYEAVVVGNVTMLHLLLGVDPSPLSMSPFTPAFMQELTVDAGELGLHIHPHGYVQTLPALGAYVGADIVGGVLATGLVREDKLRVFVDVGTNGEIVLGSAERALSTAAPAGPAFEGSQIKCGMRATVGAIEGVQLGDRVELQIIGGDVPAEGICGSGLVDAVAQLLLAGLLDHSGRLKKPDDVPDHPLRDRLIDIDGMRSFLLADGVFLTQRDIRELQFAKGSIATGIKVLMDILGVTAGDLDEVLLGGSFGSYLNPESAKVIGLVPPVDVDRIIAVGNSAGEGAKIALLSYRERQVAFELPSRIEYVELSGRTDFNDSFISVLGFPLLDEVGAARLRGPHCYEMYAGAERFEEIAAERPGTFFLTDWLVRNFDRAVIKGLGLDRDPELKSMVFGNYEALLYLRQVPNPRLADKAEQIAAYLGLPLQIDDVGLGELEDRLAHLIDG